ncbi:hypothetical protein HanHA300_Chr04g0154311 [Helianthus annuus]|nr:hypothetical protein HanHA300_Chr04g0154311 [Helianthus annuus]KAJ0933149.1 hypothetical protein HanPSC8_Chr04g0181661 [Helianthus annuus]
MSSIPPQRNTYSNVIEMEMSENEEVRIEIPDNNSTDNAIVVREWEGCLKGNAVTKRSQRRIERVPPLIFKCEKGKRNQECYEPAVVSLGPYHHNQTELAQAEKYKLITLEEFRLSCTKITMGDLYNKVFEVVEEARNCYIDGSTDGYTDEEFARMMLRDACFVLFFIECISCAKNKVLLNNEHLGALGFANVVRDIFLLENQIPFVVLKVLLELRFPADNKGGEDILNRFFNYLNYGEVITGGEKVLDHKQPLHLLELYRSYFISLKVSLGLGSTHSSKWPRKVKKVTESSEDYNYVKRNRSFASVTELKAKGIFLKRICNESSNEDIKFLSHFCYGELELVRRAVSSNTKAIYLNMIAYEMCAHNPNDFRVSTYIRVMKSLVIQSGDVKELRNHNILLHSLGRDEEVVKMYDEIDVPAVNLYMFNQLRKEIEHHCSSKYKTWAAELITGYFSSPWKTVALLVASAILFTSFLQTYFTIRPLPDDSNADMIKLLRHCVYSKQPPTKLA